MGDGESSFFQEIEVFPDLDGVNDAIEFPSLLLDNNFLTSPTGEFETFLDEGHLNDATCAAATTPCHEEFRTMSSEEDYTLQLSDIYAKLGTLPAYAPSPLCPPETLTSVMIEEGSVPDVDLAAVSCHLPLSPFVVEQSSDVLASSPASPISPAYAQVPQLSSPFDVLIIPAKNDFSFFPESLLTTNFERLNSQNYIYCLLTHKSITIQHIRVKHLESQFIDVKGAKMIRDNKEPSASVKRFQEHYNITKFKFTCSGHRYPHSADKGSHFNLVVGLNTPFGTFEVTSQPFELQARKDREKDYWLLKKANGEVESIPKNKKKMSRLRPNRS